MGEELFGLFIFVVIAAAQLVKFLGKLGTGDKPVQVAPPRQQQTNTGRVQPAGTQQQGSQTVKSLLQDALNEITGNRSVQPQQSGQVYRDLQSYASSERADYPEIRIRPKAKVQERPSVERTSKPKLFSKPSDLRQAFIMKEVLDRPVSGRI